MQAIEHPPLHKHVQFPPAGAGQKPKSINLTHFTLGQGNFGVVKYAYDPNQPGKFYAVKVMDRKKHTAEKDIKNLANEMAIMGEIKSDYVVRLMDTAKTASFWYILMELCNAGDLASYAKARGGRLVEQEARLVLKQILMGLAAIKEKNVMHRDLKLPNILVHLEMLPQNVMVDKSFDLKSYIAGLDFSKHHEQIKFKMADLGFARRLQDDELAETSCGTPLLMAPEVLNGETYNHKADIWSIGCIFYELLCGFVPFTGRNYEDLK